MASGFRARFRDMMAQVGGAAALERVPSFNECRFCDIGLLDCPEPRPYRGRRSRTAAAMTTNLF